MDLVPRLPLALSDLLAYYAIAVRECEFLHSLLVEGLGHIDVRMKPSPLVSVRFNNYEAYYMSFLDHLKWRLADLCVDENYAFSKSKARTKILGHKYAHSGVAHPIGEEEIVPMLESLDFITKELKDIIEEIESSRLSSIFLCHSSKDKEMVRKLAGDLIRKGAKVWLDEAEILVGDSIVEQIQAGISESDFLGVVLSPTAVKSIWVRREVEAALMTEIGSGRTKVLPILVEECDVPPFLKAKKYADFSSSEAYSNGLNELTKALKRS